MAARHGILSVGGLFTPYYLFDVMARLHRAELDRQVIREFATDVRNLYRSAARRLVADSSAGETWDIWQRPLLELLAINAKDVDELVQTSAGLVRIRRAILREEGDALVLMDFHAAGTDLERTTYPPGREITSQPIAQAFEAALDQHPTAKWGLLGNAAELRLYRKGGQVARQYLAADLPALIEGDLTDEWTALFACFRGESFVLQADGVCFLDRVIQESGQHSRRIADDLRDNVSEAIEALATGVIANRENWNLWEGKEPDRALAQSLFHEGLEFLYRILFVAFAEAHGQLPAQTNSIYRSTYSFEHLRDVCDHPLPPAAGDKTYLWQAAWSLFRLVRDGSSMLGIPPIGGELFAAGRMRILEQSTVADRYVHVVIRALSLDRSGRRGAPSRFSYLDLGVDQLGSVYEGLLAYDADIATQSLVEAKVTRNGKPKGDLLLVPEAVVARSRRLIQVTDAVIRPGSFLIRHGGVRRKASGSYYTPHALAQAMVEKTLEPLVQPIIEGCSSGKAKPNGILDITVIDQAMGSGAFLVHAVHFLADSYKRALDAANASDEELAPDRLAAAKRLIAQRCIYGIDLNPMAVELAKVSLWLETLALTEPLSFLDAHLRCGDALIGAPEATDGDGPRLDRLPDAAYVAAGFKDVRKRNGAELRQLERQPDLFGTELQKALGEALAELRKARADLLLRGFDPAAALETKQRVEKEKARFYAEARSRPLVRALHHVADLWCAVWFWPAAPVCEPPDTFEYREIAREILAAARELRETDLAGKAGQQLAIAERVAGERRFFHRWLEFPEIEAAGGYVAVVGNPPWETINSDRKEFLVSLDPELLTVEGKALDEGIRRLFERNPDAEIAWKAEDLLRLQQQAFFYESAIFRWFAQGNAAKGFLNTYRLFFERGVRELQAGGQCGLVLAGAFIKGSNASELRRQAFDAHRVRLLIHSDNEHKIYGAVTDRMQFDLIIVSREQAHATFPCAFLVGKRGDGGWRSLDLPDLVDLVRGFPREAVTLDRDLLAAVAPDTLTPPMLADPRDAELLARIFGRFPRFSSPTSGWGEASFGAEIHSSADRKHFRSRAWLEKRGANRVSEIELQLEGDSYIPLIEGRNVWQLLYGYTEPRLWISKASADQLLRPNRGLGGLRSNATLRAGFRDVSGLNSERTMIGVILPSRTASKPTVPYVRAGSLSPGQMVTLAAVWSSFAFDWQLRALGISRMTFGPVQDQALPPADAVADLLPAAIAALQPEWLRHQAASECAVKPHRVEWWQARADLDAHICKAYGLSLEEVGYVLSTFPMLDRQQPPLQGEQQSTITRDMVLTRFAELTGAEPPDIAELFKRLGRVPLGGDGRVDDRAQRALAQGAIPYVTMPQADQTRDLEEEDEGEEAEVVEEVMA